ncbi:Inner membrane protein YjeO [Photorhabdus australis subsp. thailandensis]|uniref:Inner membrane protein YjeO n=1 Tax=Photorhabdus australis subsp. thailandensis TaxID=2805096 RepID=A0A1C0U678_9GAMM|nr:YjeO family protein [Photorhabdus australis]OCQ53393.1 Inner membrane protein YjeO [Photorhabdus australis subsp. thailandensis]
MSKLSTVLIVGYVFFCMLLIYMMSYFEKEYYIDGIDIKNICDVYNTLVVDDTRDFDAPVSLLFLFPLFYHAAKKRFKSFFFNAISVVLLVYWAWRFFIRLIVCI